MTPERNRMHSVWRFFVDVFVYVYVRKKKTEYIHSRSGRIITAERNHVNHGKQREENIEHHSK